MKHVVKPLWLVPRSLIARQIKQFEWICIVMLTSSNWTIQLWSGGMNAIIYLWLLHWINVHRCHLSTVNMSYRIQPTSLALRKVKNVKRENSHKELFNLIQFISCDNLSRISVEKIFRANYWVPSRDCSNLALLKIRVNVRDVTMVGCNQIVEK